MLTKQLSIALAIIVCIGFGVARPDLKTFAAAPASATNFDQVFAAAARYAVDVNRVHKGDRLSIVKAASHEPLLPDCEPVASPYVDPILGRIAGRCAV
jgi:hypothetical protein